MLLSLFIEFLDSVTVLFSFRLSQRQFSMWLSLAQSSYSLCWMTLVFTSAVLRFILSLGPAFWCSWNLLILLLDTYLGHEWCSLLRKKTHQASRLIGFILSSDRQRRGGRWLHFDQRLRWFLVFARLSLVIPPFCSERTGCDLFLDRSWTSEFHLCSTTNLLMVKLSRSASFRSALRPPTFFD